MHFLVKNNNNDDDDGQICIVLYFTGAGPDIRGFHRTLKVRQFYV